MPSNQVLSRIKQIGREVGASKKQVKAAIETGIVESGLRNLPGGDADSAGWRQERAGIYKDPTNLDASIRRFYQETAAVKDKYGSAGQLAAAVQRPAAQYRGRYQQVSDRADALLGRSAVTGAAPRTTSRTVAGGGEAVTPDGANRGDLLKGYLATRGRPGATLALASGLQDLTVPTRTVTTTVPGAQSPTVGSFKITGANPSRVKPKVVQFAEQVASIYGKPLTGDSGATHSKMTVDGNVSDHWSGNATDIPLRGAALIKAGQAALIAAGMPKAQARKQTGGLFNVGGHQIIFNTHEGGDHTDHLHVSAK